MNKSDSERIAAVLEKIGYKPASKENEADLILVNMCSVRQSAVDRVYGKAKEFAKLKTKNKKLKTVLTGCVSNSDFRKFKNFFDYIFPIKILSQWPEFLKKDRYLFYPNPRDEKFIEQFKAGYLKEKSKYSKNFSAFIPISTGCDNFCTFCIVPYVRGPLICRPHQDILKEAKFALENGANPIRNTISNGAREIWLLGQNVNSYFSDKRQETSNKKVNFAKLLKMVNEIPGNFWIRFTSSHPKDFSDELIKAMAECEKVTEYLNLPVQSGDNEILKRMNRPYTVKQYKNLIKKIRTAFKKYRTGLEKEIAISTDVIVGFPGETERQFQNTVKLFEEIKYDMAYVAKYSPRPGTAAVKFKDDVLPKEKERRYKILTEVLKKTALENNKKYVGKKVEVLIDGKKGDFYFGKTRTYKTVKIKSNKNKVGQFIRVKIIDALPWGLKGNLT